MATYRVHLAGTFFAATDEQQTEFRRTTGQHGFKTEPAYGVDGGRVLPACLEISAAGPVEAGAAAERLYRRCASESGLELDLFQRLERRAVIAHPGVSL